jgi:hypothetical protein
MIAGCLASVTSGSEQGEGAIAVATDHLGGRYDRVPAVQAE